jgi:uncharacterized protein (TIGR03032 family)
MADQEVTEVIEANAETPEPKLAFSGSRLFTQWLGEQKASLVFTTYQIGKFFFIGLQPDGRLSVFERSFDRCMGLAQQDNTLWMSARYQMWRFENVLQKGQAYEGYDRLFVPMVGHTTGDADIHDLVIGPDGKPVFAVTLFNCVATLADDSSFTPIWKPSFISDYVAEDRCHLNGLAADEDGNPRYFTVVSDTNVVEGWREHRTNGGMVIDIKTNKVVCEGLSMPHSPRCHNGKIWLLNAGTGEFGYVDRKKKSFVPMAFCPGFLRGLSFSGDYAIVGLSKQRTNRTFQGLELDGRLKKEKVEARCGLQIIDLKTGAATHTFWIEGIVDELYDVAVLPNTTRPMALGFRTEEIARHIKLADPLTPNWLEGTN